MKKTALVLALLAGLSSAGCWGPQKLTRHMDDWTQQTYVDNPWFMGNIVSTAAIHAVFFFTNLLDSFINAYYFWFLDAQPLGEGTGTKFEHKPAVPARK